MLSKLSFFRTYLVFLMFTIFLFPSCSSDDDEDQLNGDVLVDISDFGMSGRDVIGTAILTTGHLAFSETEVSVSTIVFNLSSGLLSLEQFTNPPLHYNGEPVMLRVTLTGKVTDHEPGSFTIDVTGSHLRLMDQSGQMLGTVDTEDLVQGLKDNGVEFPSATTAVRFEMEFNISANDESYSKVYISSNEGFFTRFTGE